LRARSWNDAQVSAPPTASELHGSARPGAPLRGVLSMLASVLLLTLSDALTKLLSTGYPPGQIICMRSLIVIGFVLVLSTPRRRWTGLRIRSPGAHFTRGVFACAGSFLFVLAISHVPLANAMSIGFAGPLLITALAGPMLGEHVGWRRWCAVLVGFLGVLVILRPGAQGFHWAAMLLLAGTWFGALRDIVTRRISATESSSSLLLTTNSCMVGFGLLSLLQGWNMPQPLDAAWLALSGVLIGSGHYLQIEAYRHAEAGTVVPFRYTALLWAMLMGWLVFDDVPDASMLGGASLVVASGLFILHREGRVGGAVQPRSARLRIPGYRWDDTQ
jgi:drug/metabolite transporter (DMT)-like permease